MIDQMGAQRYQPGSRTPGKELIVNEYSSRFYRSAVIAFRRIRLSDNAIDDLP
jgi:hypothetical protein